MLRFVAIQVDEMVFAERRLHVQGVERTARHKLAGLLRYVDASASEAVNVEILANLRFLGQDVEYAFAYLRTMSSLISDQ